MIYDNAYNNNNSDIIRIIYNLFKISVIGLCVIYSIISLLTLTDSININDNYQLFYIISRYCYVRLLTNRENIWTRKDSSDFWERIEK